MKTKFSDFINESITDKMTPKMSIDEYRIKMQPYIDEIKDIIKKYGGVITMGDLEAEASPDYPGGIMRGVHLIEGLRMDCVDVVVYDTDGFDDPIDEYEVPYEDLDFNTLIKIKELLNDGIEYGLLENI